MLPKSRNQILYSNSSSNVIVLGTQYLFRYELYAYGCPYMILFSIQTSFRLDKFLPNWKVHLRCWEQTLYVNNAVGFLIE